MKITFDKNKRIITEGTKIRFDNGLVHQVKKNNCFLGIVSKYDGEFYPFRWNYENRVIDDAVVIS